MGDKKQNAKQYGKTGRFFKWLITNMTNILKTIFIVVLVVTLALEVIVVLYGMTQKATIEISFINGWPTIKTTIPAQGDTGGDTKPTLLGSAIGQEMAGEPFYDSVWYCCHVITNEIALKVSIDTNKDSNDKRTKEVYRCVQILLNIIGCYDGKIDGDQGRTKASLAAFQKGKGLDEDCKLGWKTWRAMLIMLTREIH